MPVQSMISLHRESGLPFLFSLHHPLWLINAQGGTKRVSLAKCSSLTNNGLCRPFVLFPTVHCEEQSRLSRAFECVSFHFHSPSSPTLKLVKSMKVGGSGSSSSVALVLVPVLLKFSNFSY